MNNNNSVMKTLGLLSFTLSLAVTASAASTPNEPLRFHAAGEPLLPEQLSALFAPGELNALSIVARQRMLERMRELSFSQADAGYVHVDTVGGVYFADTFPAPPSTEEVAQGAALTEEIAAEDVFSLHSHPGATRVVYLDFDGHTITDTAWNNSSGVASLEAVPYDLDGDPATFSATERSRIGEIWHRVAEDLAPFTIDVTTEEPASFTSTTGRILITRSTTATGGNMPSSSAGGVAYVNVFGRLNYATYYSPALVYFNHLGGGSASAVSEAAIHEFGHNLGLSHDGTSSVDYYQGHGDGFVSWAPIMGVGYYKNVTQWSKGEYPDANQTQDDLAIIDGKLGYRADDHGDTPATATALLIEANGDVLVTHPESDPFNDHPDNKGVIELRTDVDVFFMDVAEGPLSLTVMPAWKSFYRDSRRGANLDVSLRLLDAQGAVVTSDDPLDNTNATVAADVRAGRYYLEIDGVGNSVGEGYSDYGSLGQYFVSGTVTPDSATRYTIGGTVAGLSGGNLTLQNNGGDNLSINTNGGFVFASKVADGGSYAVTVLAQPGPSQNCSVANGAGTVSGADITDVAVTCVTADTTPDPFSFTAVQDVDYDPRVRSQSEEVTITGIDAPSSVSIQNGEYRINGGGWQSSTGQINNNDRMQLRHWSSDQPATSTTTTLDIGGVSADFVSVTKEAPIETLSADAGPDGEIEAVTGGLELRAAASGGIAPYAYSWVVLSEPVNAQYGLGSADTMTSGFSAQTPGDYTLTLTVRDVKGNEAQDRVLVRVIIPDHRVVKSELGQSLSACQSIRMEAGVGKGMQVKLRAPLVIFGAGFSVPSESILQTVSEADAWCTTP